MKGTVTDRARGLGRPGPSVHGGVRLWKVGIQEVARDPFLVLLPVTVFVVGLLWVAVIPLWQTPDEPAHFSYVQSLGERTSLFPQRFLSRELVATNELSGMEGVPGDASVTQPFVPDSDSGPAESKIASLPRELREKVDPSFGNSAAAYPPGYYLLASLVYRLLSSGDIFSIMFGLRVFSALLTSITLLFHYLTLRLYFADRTTARVTAFLIALSPMYVFMGMAVNVEVLLWLLFSIYLYLLARALREGLSAKMNLVLAVVVALGLWVKQTFMVGILFYLLLLGFLRLRRSIEWSQLIRAALMFSGVVALMAGWLYVSGTATTSPEVPPGEPSLAGFLAHFVRLWRSYRWALQETFWGSFGWLDTPLSQTLYAVLGFVSVSALAGFLWYIVSTKRRKELPDEAVFFSLVVVLFAGAFVVLNYLVLASGAGWFLQGRYLFPIMAPIMAILVTGLTWKAPERSKTFLLMGMMGAMVFFHTITLFDYVIPRYYL